MAQSRASLVARVEGAVALLACRAVPGDRTAASVRGGSLCVAVIACLCALTGAAGPYSWSKARLLLRVLGRAENLQTALGLCHGWFFPKRAPKSSVRRHRCISTRKKRDTA